MELAEAVRDMGYMPEQVQDFYPTPSTMSTCMYYTGVDPRNMQPIYVPRDPHEKAMHMILDGDCGAFNPLLIDCLIDLQDRIVAEKDEQDSPPPLFR